MGLFGTGGQAGPQLEALAQCFSLRRVRVFSPTPENRRTFATHWSKRLDIEVDAVDDPHSVMRGVDIVAAATNSLSPVFDGSWIEPGMHVNSVQRAELDDETIARADFIIVRSVDRDTHWYIGSRTPAEVALDRSDDPGLRPRMRTLEGILAHREVSRTHPEQITLFSGGGLGSAGLGIQLISVAALAYRRAREAGLGRELPDEWFSQEIHT